MASALEPDADTKSFVEYVESCQHPIRPGNQLCLAYEEIHGFYVKLVPDATAQTLLKEAFAAFHETDVETLCRALGELGPVLKGITVNGSESKFYRTLTATELCSRRCGELHEESEQITLRPICKVLAYELHEISKRNVAIKHDAPQNQPIDTKSPAVNSAVPKQELPVAKHEVSPEQSHSVAAVAISSSSTQEVVVKEKLSTSATEEEKKPVSITPGTNPQLAEDVQPIAPLVNQKVSSTSTMDYSGVIVPNNNEPEDNIKMPITDTKQSQQPADTNGGDDKMGGSLDGDQGGQFLPEDADMLNGDDDGDDGDYGMDEKNPVPEKSDSEKPQQKSAPNEGGEVGKVEKLPRPAHNKKPTQVGDSFEVEGRLEEMNHHNSKMTEMVEDPFYDEADSNFFAYFMFLMAVCVLGYVAYHNKKKVLGLLLEGRRGRSGRGSGSSSSGSRRSRRGSSSRKHTAAYQKLDSNLEEAITSTGQSRSSQIIY